MSSKFDDKTVVSAFWKWGNHKVFYTFHKHLHTADRSMKAAASPIGCLRCYIPTTYYRIFTAYFAMAILNNARLHITI